MPKKKKKPTKTVTEKTGKTKYKVGGALYLSYVGHKQQNNIEQAKHPHEAVIS